MRRILIVTVASLGLSAAAYADESFLCAGDFLLPEDGVAAKPAVSRTVDAEGPINVLVIFGKFKGEYPDRDEAPSWALDLFDPDRPGSVSHFYHTMSRGRLQLQGAVAPGYYEAANEFDYYQAERSNVRGEYPEFSHEVLALADADIDYTEFDNDGRDGIPNSGDDDRVVDAVFIILNWVPRNFLVGPATGIMGLGLYPEFLARDKFSNGNHARVSSKRLFVMQGRSFTEAAGVLSHEFGHLLGLPDLFNLRWVLDGGGPGADSAGIGAWGLMGWGALGWKGVDGPNPLSTWSRVQLGWVERQRPRQQHSQMRLAPMEESGEVYEILLPNSERFLISNHRRSDNHYNRNMPGDGLLIWHADPTKEWERVVDLECADGRWQSSGFPHGTTASPERGEDNLDFWSHDGGYTREHAGNRGDSTDLFDGDQFRAFTPETNPSSVSNDGMWSARVEDIQFGADGVVTAQLEVEPLVVIDPQINDASGDGVLVAGETAEIGFRLASWSSIPPELRVEVSSADTLINILDPIVDIQTRWLFQIPAGWNDFDGEIAGGMRYYKAEDFKERNGIPSLEVKPGFVGVHQFDVSFSIFDPAGDGSDLIWMETYPFEVISARPPRITGIAVVDSAGNGDGLPQAGEFIRLVVEVEGREEMLQAISVSIRSLQEEVKRLSSQGPNSDEGIESDAANIRSPEFQLSSALIAGTILKFEIAFDSGYETSVDTLQVEVAIGSDLTPPRVLPFSTRDSANGISVVLPESRVTDPGPIRAWGVIYGVSDTTEIAMVELARVDDRYEAIWGGATDRAYFFKGFAADEAGNIAETPLRLVGTDRSPPATPFPGGVIELPVSAPVADLAYSPDGTELAVAVGRTIELYDVLSLRRTAVLIGHVADVTSVAFSPIDLTLASGDTTGTVRLWDSRTHEEIAALEGHSGRRITGLAFSPARPTLVSAGLDSSLALWDLVDLKKTATLIGDEPEPILSLAVDPLGGNLIAAGSGDGSVALWSMTRGEQLNRLAGHSDGVSSVAFSNDGSRFLSASRDGTVRLRSVVGNRMTLRQVLREHEDWIEAAAFGPNGVTLASASLDGTIYLRNVDASQSSLVKLTNAGGTRSIAFNPEGTQITTGNWNGTLQFWQVWDDESDNGLTSVTPMDAALLPSYPNPFNDGTQLPFRLFRQSSVEIHIYDTLGQLVRVIDFGDRQPGVYTAARDAVFWDGRDDAGQPVASGVYIGVLQAGNTIVQQKMVVLR